jgi:hypothetical protein
MDEELIIEIKNRLRELTVVVNCSYGVGYITALADQWFITSEEYKVLYNWIMSGM